MTLVKGQTVTINSGGRSYDRSSGLYGRVEPTEGTRGVVSRVGRESVLVGFPPEVLRNNTVSSGTKRVSAWIPLSHLTAVPLTDAQVKAAKKAAEEAAKPKRKLGEKPEGDQFIGTDHPGLQWLWDDVAKYATKSSYCYQYDSIAANFGIPGRKRDFSVTRTINGLKLTTTVKARSQDEADKLVEDTLGAKEDDSASVS